MVGKTNMDQFAAGLVGTRTPFGTARNAFDERSVPAPARPAVAHHWLWRTWATSQEPALAQLWHPAGTNLPTAGSAAGITNQLHHQLAARTASSCNCWHVWLAA